MSEPVTIGDQVFINDKVHGWIDRKTRQKADIALCRLLDSIANVGPVQTKTKVKIDKTIEPISFGGQKFVFDVNQGWVDAKTKVKAPESLQDVFNMTTPAANKPIVPRPISVVTTKLKEKKVAELPEGEEVKSNVPPKIKEGYTFDKKTMRYHKVDNDGKLGPMVKTTEATQEATPKTAEPVKKNNIVDTLISRTLNKKNIGSKDFKKGTYLNRVLSVYDKKDKEGKTEPQIDANNVSKEWVTEVSNALTDMLNHVYKFESAEKTVFNSRKQSIAAASAPAPEAPQVMPPSERGSAAADVLSETLPDITKDLDKFTKAVSEAGTGGGLGDLLGGGGGLGKGKGVKPKGKLGKGGKAALIVAGTALAAGGGYLAYKAMKKPAGPAENVPPKGLSAAKPNTPVTTEAAMPEAAAAAAPEVPTTTPVAATPVSAPKALPPPVKSETTSQVSTPSAKPIVAPTAAATTTDKPTPVSPNTNMLLNVLKMAGPVGMLAETLARSKTGQKAISLTTKFVKGVAVGAEEGLKTAGQAVKTAGSTALSAVAATFAPVTKFIGGAMKAVGNVVNNVTTSVAAVGGALVATGTMGKAAAFIAGQEGLPKGGKAMMDVGHPAIGYGHDFTAQELKQGFIVAGGQKIPLVGPNGMGTVINKDQATALLQSDLPKYQARAAKPLGDAWGKLDDSQKAALISYAYNTGSTVSLVKKGLKDAIVAGDMSKAADIIRNGIATAGGVVLPGLQRRRSLEASLFSAGGAVQNVKAGAKQVGAAASGAASSGFQAIKAGSAALGKAGVAAGTAFKQVVGDIMSFVTLANSSVDLGGLNSSMKERVKAMAAEYKQLTGKKIQINSGYRSPEKQAALYKKIGPPKAAPPGRSLHEKGLAIDVNSSDGNSLEKMGLLAKYGFVRPMSYEPWHIQPVGARGAKQPDNPYQKGAPIVTANKNEPVVLAGGKAKPIPASITTPTEKAKAAAPKPSAAEPVTAPSKPMSEAIQTAAIDKNISTSKSKDITVASNAPTTTTPQGIMGNNKSSVTPNSTNPNSAMQYKLYFNAA